MPDFHHNVAFIKCLFTRSDYGGEVDCISYQFNRLLFHVISGCCSPVISGHHHEKWSDVVDTVCMGRRELRAEVIGQNSDTLCSLLKCQKYVCYIATKAIIVTAFTAGSCTKHAGS